MGSARGRRAGLRLPRERRRRVIDAGADARSAALVGLAAGTVRVSVQALSGGAAGAIALSEPITVTPLRRRRRPRSPGRDAGPPRRHAAAAGAKPTISFNGAAKKVKLSRKHTFVLRFKATPGRAAPTRSRASSRVR